MAGNRGDHGYRNRVERAHKSRECVNTYAEAANMRKDSAARYMRDADPKKAPKVAPTMTLGVLIEQNADLEARIAVLITERDEARAERDSALGAIAIADEKLRRIVGLLDGEG
jgi:hypothetical protein